MNIYTITFCNTTNVGAALQEYALQKFLQSKGHRVKVVQYIPPFMRKGQSVWGAFLQGKHIIQSLKGLLLVPLKVNRKRKYIRFSQKYISLTTVCRNSLEIEKLEQPDIYVAGSDQIWNDELVDWDPGYFLQFHTPARKASYGASAGKDSFSDDFLCKLKEKTKDFYAISVRETALKLSLERIHVKDVELVLDPVFLLPREQYETILQKPKISSYVLLYEAEVNENCIHIARKLAKSYHLKIVQINRVNNRYHVDKLYPCVSPTEFLGLVKYADYVVTNSFHAVAVSLILERPFWVIKLKERFSRIASLLKIAELEDRVLNSSEADFGKAIDYEMVKRNLTPLKKESERYLEVVTSMNGQEKI